MLPFALHLLAQAQRLLELVLHFGQRAPNAPPVHVVLNL